MHAQWLNYPNARHSTYKGRRKPNLTAPAPRTADGRPDLSGVWHAADAAGWRDEASVRRRCLTPLPCPGWSRTPSSKYAINIFVDFKAEDVSIRPEAAAILRGAADEHNRGSFRHYCLPAGIPLATLVSELTKIVQTPSLTLIWLELDSAMRQIYTDGRPHPVNRNPSWLGYSIGKVRTRTRWSSDTVGFNDKTWLDAFGHPHSEAMRVVERYRRRDFGHMDVEITIDDPQICTEAPSPSR